MRPEMMILGVISHVVNFSLLHLIIITVNKPLVFASVRTYNFVMNPSMNIDYKYYKTFLGKAPSTSDGWTSGSFIACGINCALNERCRMFYFNQFGLDLDADGRSDKTPLNRVVDCIISETGSQSLDYATTGQGSIGLLKNVNVGIAIESMPKFKNAVYSYSTRTKNGLTAVYVCHGYHPEMTSFGWVYNTFAEKWLPMALGKCADSICGFPSFSASVLENMTPLTRDIPNEETVALYCADDEVTHSGIAMCDVDGNWEMTGVACISASCYRFGKSDERAHYAGRLNLSEKNEECIPWAWSTMGTKWIQSYDRAGVENFCRDPNSSGYPWCFVMSSSHHTQAACDIPRCTLSP